MPLACWFRRRAETIFPCNVALAAMGTVRKVREAETASPARETRALPGIPRVTFADGVLIMRA
jgi:hypothetical protein